MNEFREFDLDTIENINNEPTVEFESLLISKLALNQALDSLDEKQRLIIDLRYFQGKTQREVANILWIPQSLVARIEYKSIKTLRAYLK